MKKYIILPIGLLYIAVNISKAQNRISEFTTKVYVVEGTSYYDILGAKTNTEVVFYSNKGGGKVLKSATSDANGNVSVTDKNFNPAFVLDKQSKMVAFFSGNDFTLNNMQLVNTSMGNTISWTSAVKDRNEYTFEVQKSSDNIHFSTLSSVSATSEKEASYSVVDPGNYLYYKIIVENKKDGYNYTSWVISNEMVNVYPSILKDNNLVNIQVLSNNNTIVKVQLLSIDGKELGEKSFNVTQGANKLTWNIPFQRPGNYLIKVLNSTLNKTVRLTKL